MSSPELETCFQISASRWLPWLLDYMCSLVNLIITNVLEHLIYFQSIISTCLKFRRPSHHPNWSSFLDCLLKENPFNSTTFFVIWFIVVMICWLIFELESVDLKCIWHSEIIGSLFVVCLFVCAFWQWIWTWQSRFLEWLVFTIIVRLKGKCWQILVLLILLNYYKLGALFLSWLEPIFFPLIKQVRFSWSDVHNFWATIAIFFHYYNTNITKNLLQGLKGSP